MGMLVRIVPSIRLPLRIINYKTPATNIMSVYVTKSVRVAVKVEAFEKRGLSGHAACKVSESGIIALSSASPQALIRYSHMGEELTARKSNTIKQYYQVVWRQE
jgi:hypothetical protein